MPVEDPPRTTTSRLAVGESKLEAVLYGVIPLVISMLVIEVVSGWEDAPEWVRWAAYLIIGGAMYLSAAATGAVVLRAAPPHSSLLFGLLLDGALTDRVGEALPTTIFCAAPGGQVFAVLLLPSPP